MLGSLDTCDEEDVTKWDHSFAISDSRITNLPVEYTGIVHSTQKGHSDLQHPFIYRGIHRHLQSFWC